MLCCVFVLLLGVVLLLSNLAYNLHSLQIKGYSLKLSIAARGSTQAAEFRAKLSGAAELKYCNIINDGTEATLVLENPVGSGSFITYGCLCKMVSDRSQQSLLNCEFFLVSRTT